MTEPRNKHLLLIVEDDEDDYFLITQILKKTEIACEVRWAKDGEEAMNYLLRQKEWQESSNSPRPSLILLDINMPKKNGLEVLQDLQKHPTLKNLFTIVFTSSKNEDNIILAYNHGANSYIQKPSEIEQLTKKVQTILDYWLQWVEPPFNLAEGK
ncbi:MAG: response regulator [Nitrospinae bacterium]|nr:response regulator [Nitrospinota bacterium]